MRISIHAPRKGSDQNYWRLDSLNENISIHAPRKGSDGSSANCAGISL